MIYFGCKLFDRPVPRRQRCNASDAVSPCVRDLLLYQKTSRFLSYTLRARAIQARYQEERSYESVKKNRL